MRGNFSRFLLAATVLGGSAQAQAANCSGQGAAPLTIGSVASVAPGAARAFTLNLKAGDGVIIDLTSLTPAAQSDDHDEHEGGSRSEQAPRALALCNAGGTLLAPQPSEVFAKGGSISTIDDGERMRFSANAAGQYMLTIAAGTDPREVLVRRRDVPANSASARSARLGADQTGNVSSSAPVVYSFTSTAGQWVELKAESDKDTVLRLAGPDRTGAYSQLAENDDSEGTNPRIRRKLAVAGTYYVQVDSLSSDDGEFTLKLNSIAAPKPLPAPAALRADSQIAGRLADGDAVMVYAMPVIAGHSYRLDLTAPYDGVVAIGLPNPLEVDDEKDAGFTEVKSQDSGTTGTEKLNFTARTSGQLLVRVKSFGIGETDGAYSLTATDLGG